MPIFLYSLVSWPIILTQSTKETPGGAARYSAKFMGERSFYDIVIISCFIKR